MNIYETLICELNKIIGLLEASELEIYQKIENNDRYGYGLTISNFYDNKYEEYRNHICCSGLLLGFSYFESYAYDLLGFVLKEKPELNNHKFTLKYVIDNKTNLFNKVIEDYLRSVGFTEVIKCLNKELQIFTNGEYEELMQVYNIRNCIMHNGGIADDRVNQRYSKGERIVLNSGDVNTFGIRAREISTRMWSKYNEWKNVLTTAST